MLLLGGHLALSALSRATFFFFFSGYRAYAWRTGGHRGGGAAPLEAALQCCVGERIVTLFSMMIFVGISKTERISIQSVEFYI